MHFFEKAGNGILYRSGGETVLIEPWGEDSLRIRSCMLGEIQDTNAALLDPVPVTPDISINDTSASITCGRITAELEISRPVTTRPLSQMRITFKNSAGDVLLREVATQTALTLNARDFKALPGGGFRLRQTFEADPAEKIYGMGQYQQERLDLKGCNLELAQRNSQASIPFCISSLGYGFFWNNPAIGAVHFGMNTTEWNAECTDQLDYWITAGDTPAAIEEYFADAVGKEPMMPEYGLGFWQCKLRYYNQEQVEEIAGEYHRRGIPVDVFVIDYYHWPRCGDYRFDEEYFPDPASMVKKLHDMGMETMVSVWPQVDWRSENYMDLLQKGLLVQSNSGVDVQMVFHGNNVFIDATNPRTRAYVWEIIKKNYFDKGIRCFWLDEAEPEFTYYDFEHYRYHAGPALKVGNIYPREYARMIYEGQMANGQTDIVNLLRCAWAGSQKYGVLVWSGDVMSTWEDFRKQLCAGLNIGLAGIPWWTTDIGGFHHGNVNSEDFRELLVRWFAFGTFCPVMRLHGSREPGKQIVNKAGEVREGTGAPNEIWSYGEKNYEIMKKYIGIRQLMRPYIRSLMREAHEKGTPVMRTLFYEFPQDESAWTRMDEYMFGGDLLVAPVMYPHILSREVYLPAGASWTDAHSGEVYEGGQTIRADAPVDTIPVFLRDGRQDYLVGEI